jgi:hypothetical protein
MSSRPRTRTGARNSAHTRVRHGRGSATRTGAIAVCGRVRRGVRVGDDGGRSRSVKDAGEELGVARPPEGKDIIKMSSDVAPEVVQADANFWSSLSKTFSDLPAGRRCAGRGRKKSWVATREREKKCEKAAGTSVRAHAQIAKTVGYRTVPAMSRSVQKCTHSAACHGQATKRAIVAPTHAVT